MHPVPTTTIPYARTLAVHKYHGKNSRYVTYHYYRKTNLLCPIMGNGVMTVSTNLSSRYKIVKDIVQEGVFIMKIDLPSFRSTDFGVHIPSVNSRQGSVDRAGK
jgi:hypothetical protein